MLDFNSGFTAVLGVFIDKTNMVDMSGTINCFGITKACLQTRLVYGVRGNKDTYPLTF